MSNKDWFDDFMDYKLSTEPTKENPSDNSGCLTSIFWLLVVLLVISKIF